MKNYNKLLALGLLTALVSCSKDAPQASSTQSPASNVVNTANPATSELIEGWPSQYTGVMLQAFAWDSYVDSRWVSMEAQAKELAPYFSLIWTPPSAKAKAFPSMGYDIAYYFDQNSAFGQEAQLRSMIKTFRAYGVGVIADVVLNHRANMSDWVDFYPESYKGQSYAMSSADIVSNDEAAAKGFSVGPNADTGEVWEPMRDLDHKSANVQRIIRTYLDFLKNDLGYLGFRYDMVKGYAPSYTAQYNREAKVQFSVGEYWDDYDNIQKWLEGTSVGGKYQSAAFDFPSKYALNKACNDGLWNELMWKRNGTLAQPAGLIHMDKLQRYAVTFVDNHDTEREEGNKISKNILAANAFILTMPGTPCVFLPHWQQYKAQIKTMIKARQAAGLHNESEVEVLQTDTQTFAARSKGLHGELIVKVGPSMAYNAPAGYTLVTAGENYAIWLDAGALARYRA
ncbi:MAG: alpha-amylase family glycosyl hydrolase [Porphyromonas sp.]|nr:alpha-amylase family glycosyl hydrolase [Porphyromonas sp.]